MIVVTGQAVFLQKRYLERQLPTIGSIQAYLLHWPHLQGMERSGGLNLSSYCSMEVTLSLTAPIRFGQFNEQLSFSTLEIVPASHIDDFWELGCVEINYM